MRCVSLFSGCGGLDLGLRNVGFDIVLATDSDPLCAESHKANFPETNFLLAPIQDVDQEHLDTVLAGGPVELLAGGPPCPPYSKSRFYRPDKPRALGDPVGDATLNGYLKILRLAQPVAFLFENVYGFGYKVHREALTYLEAAAHELGYKTSWAILNAADYGVPQIRERFFMIGSRKGLAEMPVPTHAKQPETTLLDGPLEPWVSAGEVLADLDTEENADDTGHFAGGQYHNLLCEIPPGDNYLYLTAKRGHPEPKFEWRKRYWSFLLKLSPDMPSWTIQARRSNNMGPFHWRNRILRISEIKRLQTFPNDWQLAGRTEDQWRQVGNAVPPLLAQAVGMAVREHLLASQSA
ncbi:MAG TPA: DNA cytosine methyltransferase [Propionibacteriaceae bacterium]|nr:DNA cytosine methyltransferase [Propionibacteriaceae bacterium]